MGKYQEQILNVINHSHSHPTAEDVFLALREQGSKVALATIYNNLNALCDAGLIRRVTVEGAVDRFDKVTKHDHLICKVCGKLSDVCFHDLTGELESQLGDAVLSYDLKVCYICPECRAKQTGIPG